MLLDRKTFSTVIDATPLVSIDLIILNGQGQALLGERLNRPAKGFWFVPGGRIFKGESIVEAFERLTKEELGQPFSFMDATLLGPYDHFYGDSVYGDELNTHYVAIAYVLKLPTELHNLPLNVQHGKYKWFEISELLSDSNVHLHTKWYFEKLKNSQV
ncbi:hypothetical protein N473_05610 [Pseudoalteromonas luteoviolacea CPMOR-1]|uniref:Nudix hydrolase domain-containing protein n=1 Tax=Pseudoalteromonas luteoviolacea CPMOR-1 TaxID=1365248 RepID=A0A167HK25_9GAMM|nr:GDP-mannose mannosyl hydrolase [Pseudoalteromonas luteoviolacea]KZN58217.1 hypothetical protein N473_05610 [Pseudoalteromonas luteoviolacea CPMOR-1]